MFDFALQHIGHCFNASVGCQGNPAI
jgi:hypothetical protein